METKPPLILVAAAILPGAASEAGKGFGWALALSKIYSLHIVTSHRDAEASATAGIPDSTFHPIGDDDAWVSRWRSYLSYARWCRNIIPFCATLIGKVDAVGLHHATFASFRFLPRYDKLGIPYTLGPLGGGEAVGLRLLMESAMPLPVLLTEAARLPLNEAVRLNPETRCVIGRARAVLSTTDETAALLRKVGARTREVVFPDSLPHRPDRDVTMRDRHEQAGRLQDEFRCIFSGRATWWKGPQLAVRLIARLRAGGLNCTLHLYSEGAALSALRTLVTQLQVDDAVFFPGYANRAGLAQAYRDSHAFILPSMHESSSSALLEGYAMGLPSVTLGVGGTATITTPATGVNAKVTSIASWYDEASATIATWIQDPAQWLATCEAAVRRAQEFTSDHLDREVARRLGPDRYARGGARSERSAGPD